MINAICLNEKYSTTRLLAKEKPIIKNSSKDKFDTLLFLPENENRKGEGGLRTQGYFKQSYDGKPLVTIITVVYNGKAYLEETIQSVLKQTYDNMEYIVIDGGSTDGTIDIIRKYDDVIDYWVSESDGGIYDAMNKGITLCTGVLIGLINADDYYDTQSIQKVAETYLDNVPDLIYGDIGIINDDQKSIVLAHSMGRKYRLFPYSKKWIWVQMIFGHPASFVTVTTYKKFGLYDQSFSISADYDFFIRLFLKRIKSVYIQEALAWFRIGGISSINHKRVQEENHQVRAKHNLYIAWVVKGILFLRQRLRKI